MSGVARLVVLTLAFASSSFAQDGLGASVAGRIAPSRPEAQAGPTRVSVGLYVIDISKINDVDQSMTADFAFRATWRDPRLASSGDQVREFPLSSVWTPRLTVINKRRIWKT